MRIGAISFIDLLPTISISRDPLQLHHPFYVSQTTSSDCSVASITMATSFMLGLPAGAEEPIVTQSLLLKKIVDARWAKDVANGGSGVSFRIRLGGERSLATFHLQDHVMEIIRPTDDMLEALASLRQALATNEASD